MATEIANYSRTREILDRHGLLAKKSLGQHFLTDRHVLDKILASAKITKEHSVIEVGPGLGALTERLSDQAGRVVAVEIDSALIPVLEENLAGRDNVEIINEDILKLDLKALVAGMKPPVVMVANLPYYITTPIIMGVLEKHVGLESITAMIQKEVGERMKAKPSTKEYGALTLSVAYYADASIVAAVPVNCFLPRPNVDSCVIRLELLKDVRVKVKNEAQMFALIKAAFSTRRKTLANCLSAEGFGDKARLTELFVSLGYSGSIRGEALTLADFARLSDVITIESGR